MSNVAVKRTVAACYENGSTSIPLPKSLTRTVSADKWRAKYEESEKKRKTLIAQQERASRDYGELGKKFNQLKLHNTVVESELSDKSEQLLKLRTVSQSLYKEYDTLKNQYDLETGAMHRALSEATGWYRQNVELKRKSVLLFGNATLTDVVDTGDEEDDRKELEGLRESVKELSANNARLQTELSEAKLSEFEATEQVVNLTQEVDELEQKCKQFESEVNSLKTSNEQMLRVTKLMSEELKELQDSEKKYREDADTLRRQADDARKERNVLAHQSTILMQGIALDDDRFQMLQEIENLKRQLEDVNNKYERDVTHLQEKLEERENDTQIEILEERLKLVESELQQAQEKVERLENQSLENILPPPPPPPPPLPPPSMFPSFSSMIKEEAVRPDTNDSLPQTDNNNTVNKLPIQAGINDIVNQIKGGKFTLKSTNNKQNKKEREEPKAVSEMLRILGTLRRCPKSKINAQKTVVNMGDVQL